MLFQVHFLSLLLEERDAGTLAQVADHCSDKLVRRHPHVFGSASADNAAEVLRGWDETKKGEPGRGQELFEEVPENLPALLQARKLQRRAASSGFDWPRDDDAMAKLREELEELATEVDRAQREPDAAQARERAAHGSDRLYAELGDVLFATVALARRLRVDPELALRESAGRFRGRVEGAEALAGAAGERWEELDPDRQASLYERAKRGERPAGDERPPGD